MKNPTASAIEELYQFIEVGELPLTPEGNFLAYKVVRSDYKDIHTGTFDNTPGKIVKEDREKCDTNRNTTCSKGLHFCSKSYLSCFGNNTSRVVIVSISPEDVVSIPRDYNQSKGRCWKYTVVGEIPNEARSTKSTTTKEFESKTVYTAEQVPTPEGTKTCTKCKQIKSLADFHNDKKSKSGKKPQCKTCVNQAKKDRKINN
jgi:hypothetical protein